MGPAATAAIRRGDHACCVYSTDGDQAQLVGGFAHGARARGDRIVYLADQSSDAEVVNLLDRAGLDGRAELDSGSLQILRSAEMELDGGFDAERQLGLWNQLIFAARDAGYGGVAVSAEMTWAHAWGVDSDALVHYESTASPLFAGGAISALCQYDTRRFDPATVARLAHVHPCSIRSHNSESAVDYLRLHVTQSGSTRVISIGGDIDVANVGFLRSQLAALLSEGHAVADCAGVRFIDVAGCRLLREASLGGLAAGCLAISNAPPALSRVMRLCDWADGVL